MNGRWYISLDELRKQWKIEQRKQEQHAYREAHKYDGLEVCRKNVVKCGCFKKLKYCKPTSKEV